jgi:methionyl-tRNA synthetase
MSKTAYITTPIYYPSGNPHLGSAYTSTACDVWARFKRMDGFDTLFLTGTDEHGLKIQRSAEKAGLETQVYLDGINEKFREISTIMNLSNDDFIRTTETRHKEIAIQMWQKLEKNGYIYKSKYSGWYSVSDETYYTEEQLVDCKSPDSGHEVEWVEEESYFFKMSAFEEKLLTFYEENPNFIQPISRKNEVVSFVKSGLEDVSISRTTFDWGVPVPGDDKHVMYVWVDALTNYLSALGWPDGEKMKYWPAVHVVGKDILRFHAIIWPAILMAADIPLPKMIFAHGWWTSEGKKMSKSFGNVVDPKEITDMYGTDQVRYFILREISFGNDGDFSKDRLVERINSDLANSLGNLFQRVLSMIAKNVGHVPEYINLTDEDNIYIQKFDNIIADVRQDMENLQFHKALERTWQVIYGANQYMDAQEPWMLRKSDEVRMKTVLRVLMESFKYITALIKPFMPEAAEKFETQLSWNVTTYPELESADFFSMQESTAIDKPSGVFMRIQDEEVAA